MEPASNLKSQRLESLQLQVAISTLFSTDVEAVLDAVSLALCDFKSLRFEIAAILICDLGI